MAYSPKEIDDAIRRVMEVLPEEGNKIRAQFAHYETDVLTHHGAFVKLLLHLIRGWANHDNMTITDTDTNKRISEILAMPFADHYDLLSEYMNDALIHRELASRGVGPHYADQSDVIDSMRNPADQLEPMLLGKKKDWTPELTKRAILDFAFFHLSKFNAKRHKVIRPLSDRMLNARVGQVAREMKKP